ncbi:hypothetical protein [Undibacterium sp.]|uniref:hypothetical protein n=1 Tax=Undibacterium sp. TaxID=1914977 RepID=UPI00374DDA6F
MASNAQNKEASKGFAGISAMVSDASVVVAAAEAQAQAQPQAQAQAQQQRGRKAGPNAKPSGSKVWPDSKLTHENSYAARIHALVSFFSWSFSAVVLIFAVGYLLKDEKPGQELPSAAVGVADTEPAQISPAYPQTKVPAQAETSMPKGLELIGETIPAIGDGTRMLTKTELRYCLAHEIRTRAAAKLIDATKSRDVNLYNSMITDLNGRCGSFRYRKSEMAEATDYVEILRPELEEQGRRIARNIAASRRLLEGK